MMKDAVNQSFGAVFKVFSFLGLYLPEKPTTHFVLRAYVFYSFVVLNVTLISINVFIKQTVDTIEHNFMCIYVCEVVSQSLKAVPFLLKRQEVEKTVNFFAKERFRPANAKEGEILDACFLFCWRVCRLCLCIIIVGEILFHIPVIFSGEKYKLPVEAWLPYDVRSGNIIVYYSTWFVLFLGNIYTALSGILIDAIITGLFYFAISYLKVLKYNLRNFDKFAQGTAARHEDHLISYDSVRDILKRCVALHCDVLFFMTEFEKNFSWCLFSQIVGSMLSLCFCCIGITMIPVGSANFFRVGTAFITIIWQVFFYCYFASLLLEESNGLTNAVYQGPWYKCAVKIRKLLITLMERAHKPLTITAGEVVDVNLSTFVTTMKSSYSLIAVLKNM